MMKLVIILANLNNISTASRSLVLKVGKSSIKFLLHLSMCKLGPFNHVMKSLAKKFPEEVETFLDTVQVS